MSNNKQSSVEWLHHEFERIDKEFHVGTYEYNDAKNLAFKISKAMHKDEHFNTWWHGISENEPITFEEYYNETFGECNQ